MLLDRREFMAAAAASFGALIGRRARAETGETALGIHRATRNTWRGAIGARLRAYRRAAERHKAYPGFPRQSLPQVTFEEGRPLFEAVGDYRPGRSFAAPGLSLTELTRLLLLTNGVTSRSGRIPLRAAPSAGALYAGEVYVVVERVGGVAPGVYSYHVGEHQLIPLRKGSLIAEVERAAERPLPGAAGAFVLTNVFGRSSTRYANRGYRYALIDSGHIGENLRLAAWEMGLADAPVSRFEDDRLNRLLEIDGREEAVCAVHLIGRPGAKPAPGSEAGLQTLVERQSRGALPVGLSAPARYHEATKLVPATDAPGSTAEPERPGPAPTLAPTPELETASSVHAAIRTRRSTRHFEARALPHNALLSILALARGHAPLHRSGDLDLYCVANRVTGLDPGLYRYDPSSRSLGARRHQDLTAALVRACLGQAKSGEAAAALICVARLAEASASAGARAYRDLLLDAGATAQRIYLGAEALGYTARNLAAFYDDELDALLGLDGERDVAVHLTALGVGD